MGLELLDQAAVVSLSAAMQTSILGFVIATLAVVPAQASLCGGANAWLNPATGETGACISNTAGFPAGSFTWHCPWESDGLVSGFGCAAAKYDCDVAAALISYYGSGPPKEWGPARTDYTVNCIKFQCMSGPAPVKPASWASPARLLSV